MSLDAETGGGTAERTSQLGIHLARAGVDCRILTMSVGREGFTDEKENGLRIIALPCLNARYFVPRISASVVQAVVNASDIVHIMGHWSLLNAFVYRMARTLRKPYVINAAGALPIYGRSKILKRIYNMIVGHKIIRNASAWIAITDAERNEYEEYGILRELVTIIPNAIDCKAIARRDDVAFRRKYGLAENPFILFMGRINHIKGPDLLIQAFVDVKDKISPYHLVLAGPDGGMLYDLKRSVARQGAEKLIRFIGYVGPEEKYLAYQAADLLVVPSRQEAMSIVALEAGVVGTPVVLTNQCGFHELALSGGASVVDASASEISRGILGVLSSQDKLHMMKGKIQKYVVENYKWENIVNKYLAVYERILSAVN
jgi:glycosyltransferase involved in cell wall biosynthesis